jgi:hypothetical protein
MHIIESRTHPKTHLSLWSSDVIVNVTLQAIDNQSTAKCNSV